MKRCVSRTPSYLEYVDSSWLDIWRIELSLVSNLTPWITTICLCWVVSQFLAPWHTYKFIKTTVILGRHWWFLTGHLDDWVDFTMFDDPGISLGSFLESFMNIWLDMSDILWISSFRLNYTNKEQKIIFI